ncbi:MAG: hypothetical protein QOG13_1878 [Sphingomonadales bacterium]|nr:hypothetical protein [Sphingomonadales bacterium]
MSSDDTKTEWIDPDDAPELDDDWFDRAAIMIGDEVIRPGRPRGSAKQAVSIRLDREVVEKFKATGRGWQSRINEALKRARV